MLQLLSLPQTFFRSFLTQNETTELSSFATVTSHGDSLDAFGESNKDRHYFRLMRVFYLYDSDCNKLSKITKCCKMIFNYF